jgi:gamma-glutamylcyclotransferase (GGCT)/AIG2-like uncharacterized protein YtfP/general stress protein 26
MEKLEQVFVYGTLRPPRVDIPPDSSRFYPQIKKYVQASTPATLSAAVLYDMGTYPSARPGKGEVHGDLLTLDPAALPIMDLLEGHPHFYYRERVSVQTGSGAVDAWIYWAPEALLVAASQITSGDWFARQEPSEAGESGPLKQNAVESDPQLLKVLSRFSASPSNWLNTVRPDGRAHSAPVWHVWRNGRIYVVTTNDAVKTANIHQHPGVVLTHPDPDSPVILEGWATFATATRAHLQPLFKAKYDWDLERSPEYDTIIEITPTKLMTWGEHGDGRWTGADLLIIQTI